MRGDRQRRSGVLWAIGLVVTALLHGGVISGVFFLRYLDAKAQAGQHSIVDGPVFDVQAVKFGKPRDLSFLPHKQAVVANKGPKPKIALTENDKALPKLKDPDEKAPQVDDPLHNVHSFDNATDPEQPGVEEEGRLDGIKGGNALVGRGPIYLQKLQAAVQNVWSVPKTISDEKVAKLTATVCMEIDAAGKIGSVKMKASSGEEAFDSTLLAAIAAATLEPPDAEAKPIIANGVCMIFKPEKAR